MMNSNLVSLIQLSENDKRLIIVLLLIFILLFIIAGYVGLLVKKIMKIQGNKIDDVMHNMVITKVITDKKQFQKIAFKKSMQILFKQAFIPFIILLVAIITIIIGNVILNHNGLTLDFFQYNNGTPNEGGTGINTLFHVFDFSSTNSQRGEPSNMSIFGLNFAIYWPALVNEPHFSVSAIPSYIAFPLLITGIGWFLVCTQAFIARTIHTYRRAKTLFDKSLEGYSVSKGSFEKPNQNNEQK